MGDFFGGTIGEERKREEEESRLGFIFVGMWMTWQGGCRRARMVLSVR